MNNYEPEMKLIELALSDRWDTVQHILRNVFTPTELDALTDMLDVLAAKVDEEAIRRAEKRQ